MDPARGHCNGTRYTVRDISRRYINRQIVAGERAVHPTYTCIPLSLTRSRCSFQYVHGPAFAMSTNKAQGQTLQCVRVLLDEPVFSDGQLYVSASRCGDPQNLRLC